MRIISRKALREFWESPGRQDAEQPLKAWFREASLAKWKDPGQVKAQYANASLVGNNRVVFNIAGNKYRLIVKINYAYQLIYIRFVGTHKEYDGVDAYTV